MEFIKSTVFNGVASIHLNRPDKLNSFNRAMSKELQAALREAKENSLVRAVLLTAEGRGFCAGQDLSEVIPEPGNAKDLGSIVSECYNPIIRAIRQIPKPVVCVVKGVAAGAGANLALACDIVYAGEDANFIQSFSKVGLIPDSGGTFFLPRLIGFGKASALTFLAEKVGAQEALSMGMIYKVLPSDKVYEEALKVAEYLATQPTMGLALTKELLNESFNSNLETQLQREEHYQRLAGATEDYAEGVKAFVEKRTPQFKGK